MTRLFVVGGVSQLYFLVASLESEKERIGSITTTDYLVLTGVQLTDKRRIITENVARKVWNWTKIIWKEEFEKDLISNQILKNKKILVNIREEIGLNSVDELWLCVPFGKTEKIFYYAFPDAKIVYSEEGLGGYIQNNDLKSLLKHPSIFKKKCKIFFNRFVLNHYLNKKTNFNLWPLKSFEKSYFLFPELLTSKSKSRSCFKIKKTHFFEVLDKLKTNDISLQEGHKCLILGQCFHKFGMLTWEEEKKLYENTCKQILGQGINVYWKEHPKNNKPFFASFQLDERLKNLNDFFDFEMPVEIIANDLDFDFFVSATSTSLIIFQEYYSKTSYTIASLFKKYLTGKAYKVLKLVENHIEALPQTISTNENR